MPESRVLRIFGATTEEVRRAISGAGVGGQLVVTEKTNREESLIALRPIGLEQEQAERAIAEASHSVMEACGTALYGEGSRTLPACAVEALEKNGLLLACCNAETGALIEPGLENVEDAELVYDFGTQSYAHSYLGRRLKAMARQCAARRRDPVQAGILLVRRARRFIASDLAAAAVPYKGHTVLLLGGPKEVLVHTVSAEETPGLRLMDMIRRAYGGLPAAEGTYTIRYGAEVPAKALMSVREERKKQQAMENRRRAKELSSGEIVLDTGFLEDTMAEMQQAGFAGADAPGPVRSSFVEEEPGVYYDRSVLAENEKDLPAEEELSEEEPPRPRFRLLRMLLAAALILLLVVAVLISCWVASGGSWENARQWWAQSFGSHEFSLLGAWLL